MSAKMHAARGLTCLRIAVLVLVATTVVSCVKKTPNAIRAAVRGVPYVDRDDAGQDRAGGTQRSHRRWEVRQRRTAGLNERGVRPRSPQGAHEPSNRRAANPQMEPLVRRHLQG